jgi:exodeoxyribonuclease VII large subunit
LEEDGIIDMNAELELPLVVQNIAVISSPTAAGYGDFENQIRHNQYNYKFNYQLFEAKMQGADTGSSIISALDLIYENEDKYDAVIIIRGGGSKMDLAGFDNYELAANIAQFPLPIITGIGHERDESIADLVAHTALKTPTAVAEFLISQVHEFELQIDNLSSEITGTVQDFLDKQSYDLEMAEENIRHYSKQQIRTNEEKILYLGKQLLRETKSFSNLEKNKLSHFNEQLLYQAKRISFRANEEINRHSTQLLSNTKDILEKSNRRIKQIEHLTSVLDPKRILEQGFAMIEQNNKIISSAKKIKKTEKLKIIMQDGDLNITPKNNR